MRNERSLLIKYEHMNATEEDFEPHRIPVTVIASFIGFCIISCSVALLFQSNTFIAKRKAVQYMVLSSFGLLFYLRDSVAIVWTYPEYNDDVSTTYMYYLIAVPFHFLPIVVRSWRIFCVYRPTPTWQCKMEPITSRRKRGHQWMLTRLAILFGPWIIIAFPLAWDPFIPYYTFIGINGVVAIANLILAILLFSIRLELRPKYLDETSSLIAYSILSVIEWIFANTIYILALLIDISGALIYYVYIDMALIGVMWIVTTGKLLYRVYTRRDVIGDKKPGLETRDIQKALQRVSVILEEKDNIGLTGREYNDGLTRLRNIVISEEVESQRSGFSVEIEMTSTSDGEESDVKT